MTCIDLVNTEFQFKNEEVKESVEIVRLDHSKESVGKGNLFVTETKLITRAGM